MFRLREFPIAVYIIAFFIANALAVLCIYDNSGTIPYWIFQRGWTQTLLALYPYLVEYLDSERMTSSLLCKK